MEVRIMDRKYEVGPRFYPKTVMPEVTEGQELVKFHGQLVLIPAAKEGDPMYGRTRFTMRQAEALFDLERTRINEALKRIEDSYSIYE